MDCIRYVGVFGFVRISCFSNSYWLDLHYETFVALTNLRWSVPETWTSSSSVYGYQKCIFVKFLNQNVKDFFIKFTIGFAVLDNIWRFSPIFVGTCIFMMLVLWSSSKQSVMEYKCPIKKINWTIPAYFLYDEMFE